MLFAMLMTARQALNIFASAAELYRGALVAQRLSRLRGTRLKGWRSAMFNSFVLGGEAGNKSRVTAVAYPATLGLD